jgi:hypothetical protein
VVHHPSLVDSALQTQMSVSGRRRTGVENVHRGYVLCVDQSREDRSAGKNKCKESGLHRVEGMAINDTRTRHVNRPDCFMAVCTQVCWWLFASAISRGM